MSTFSIQRGPTALCSWNVDNGAASFHPGASQIDGVLVVEETDKLAFVLAPAAAGSEHRIIIGDVPLSDMLPTPEDASGVALGGQLFWREWAYFESAQGWTDILLEAQADNPPTDSWQPVLGIKVLVLPSKLGEARYRRMADDLKALNRGLLMDLYGKSRQTYDVRFSREAGAYHSWEQELTSISAVLDQLGTLLQTIQQRPASNIQTLPFLQRYWGQERVAPAAIHALCRRGMSLRNIERPILIPSRRKIESFDIPEHRVTRAFLDILVRRSRYCEKAARGHIAAIEAERHLRHIRFDSQPTLYESVDLPRIERLREAVHKAGRAIAVAAALENLPYLRDARPELVAVRGGTFQRNPEYKALLAIIRSFLAANAVWYEGDQVSAVTKLTSRLFEQWCYLQIVEAFRKNGLDLREWTDALRQNLQSRFLLDFDRGLMFEGMLTGDLRLRFRYEPWILGKDSALKAGETLCRGSASDVAWCPDIVIECLKSEEDVWRPVYGIVLDCKYVGRISNQHWEGTAKYQQIRSTSSMRQIAKQLWLVSPSDRPKIASEDPAVTFGETGVSCAPDEAVRFHLAVSPAPDETQKVSGPQEPNPFDQFARGTVNYLRRVFV